MERQAVDIGDGQLEAVVSGEGPVTVVFENGLATPLEFWDGVIAAVADRARTVRYDHRAESPSGALKPRSACAIVNDLERLLDALPVEPPYVLVGHSWGGVITRLFAHAHPADVAGLVFVDATHEALDSRILALLPAIYSTLGMLCRARFARRAFIGQLCPPNSPPAYRAYIEERLNDPVRWPIGLRTARAEAPAIPEALARLRRHCPDLPPIPVHVLTAGATKTKSAVRVHEAWKATVARAPEGRYTHVPTSGHYMPFDAPDVVTDAIAGVLDAVQQKARRRDGLRAESTARR